MADMRKIIYPYKHGFFFDDMPIFPKMLIDMIIHVIYISIAYNQSLFYLSINSKMAATLKISHSYDGCFNH